MTERASSVDVGAVTWGALSQKATWRTPHSVYPAGGSDESLCGIVETLSLRLPRLLLLRRDLDFSFRRRSSVARPGSMWVIVGAADLDLPKLQALFRCSIRNAALGLSPAYGKSGSHTACLACLAP